MEIEKILDMLRQGTDPSIILSIITPIMARAMGSTVLQARESAENRLKIAQDMYEKQLGGTVTQTSKLGGSSVKLKTPPATKVGQPVPPMPPIPEVWGERRIDQAHLQKGGKLLTDVDEIMELHKIGLGPLSDKGIPLGKGDIQTAIDNGLSWDSLYGNWEEPQSQYQKALDIMSASPNITPKDFTTALAKPWEMSKPGEPGAVTTTGTGAITSQAMPFGAIPTLETFADMTPMTAATFALGTGALPGYANPYLRSAYQRIYPGLANAYNMALQTGRLTAPTIGTGTAGAPIQAPGVGFAQFTQGAGGNIAQGIEQDLQTIANVKAKVAAAGGAEHTLNEQELIVYQQLLSSPDIEYKLRGELINITSPNRATRQARQALLDQQYSMGQLTQPGQPVNYGMMGAMTPPTNTVADAFPPYNPATTAWNTTPNPNLTKIASTPNAQTLNNISNEIAASTAAATAAANATNNAMNTTAANTAANATDNFQKWNEQAWKDAHYNNPMKPGMFDHLAANNVNLMSTNTTKTNGEMDLINVLNNIASDADPATGGINMNDVDAGTGQLYAGSGKNTAQMDEKYSAAVMADHAQGNPNFAALDARGDKVFFTDPNDGQNKFTMVNKEELTSLAAAKAQATGTPWYTTVFVTDPVTGRQVGMKKSSQHADVNDWKLLWVDGSTVTDTDTSPQPAPLPVQLGPPMTLNRFQEVMGQGKDWSQGLPTHTGVKHDTSVQDAWNEMQKDIAKAKSFSELMGVKDKIVNPVKKQRDDDEKEQQAFARFIYEGF